MQQLPTRQSQPGLPSGNPQKSDGCAGQCNLTQRRNDGQISPAACRAALIVPHLTLLMLRLLLHNCLASTPQWHARYKAEWWTGSYFDKQACIRKQCKGSLPQQVDLDAAAIAMAYREAGDVPCSSRTQSNVMLEEAARCDRSSSICAALDQAPDGSTDPSCPLSIHRCFLQDPAPMLQ